MSEFTERHLILLRVKRDQAERRVAKRALYWAQLPTSAARSRDLQQACRELDAARDALESKKANEQ